MSAVRSPLDRVRVLDAASFVAGPLAASMLGDLGADVVKLESPAGDPLRRIGGVLEDGMSATFAFANRGKRGLVLDPTDASDRESIARLVAGVDVVVHNQGPEAAARLGLDAAAVIVEISAFGRDGPYARRQALDPIVQAMSGIVALTGDPDGEPRRAAAPVVDVATALAAAFAALAALRAREATGQAQRATVSLFEVGLLLNAPAFAIRSARGEPLERLGNASYALLADQFAAADGLVWLAVWDERQWAGLCDLLGLPGLAADEECRTNEGRVAAQERIRPAIAESAAGWKAEELRAALDGAGIPAAVTMTLEDVIDDEHVRATGALRAESAFGNSTVHFPAGPIRLGGERPAGTAAAPRLGEHSNAVLAELDGSVDIFSS